MKPLYSLRIANRSFSFFPTASFVLSIDANVAGTYENRTLMWPITARVSLSFTSIRVGSSALARSASRSYQR